MENINWLHGELKSYFEHEATGHDYWHAVRVAKTAVHIGKIENAELEIVEVAALLHDVADWKMEASKRLSGEKKMKDWMDAIGLSDTQQDEIMHIIDNMSYKGGTNADKVLSLEGKVVQDADRIDALGAIGIARTFAFGGSKGRPIYDPELSPVEFESFEAYKKHEGASLNHFYEKLFKLKALMNTNCGKEMAEERHAFMEDFVQRFYKEWDGDL